MFTIIKIEIEQNETIPETWSVYTDDDHETDCDTKAEAYLWIARWCHQAGLGLLQDRIDNLEIPECPM